MTEEDIDKREAETIGSGQRIPPLDLTECNDDLIEMMAHMRAINENYQSRDKEIVSANVSEQLQTAREEDVTELLQLLPAFIRTAMQHPAVFNGVINLSVQLIQHGQIPLRERELLVLRTGWRCRAPHEWGEHVLVAKKLGMTSDDIARVIEGPNALGWSTHEAALISAVDELFENAVISDATWATLGKSYNRQQLMEVPLFVGQFQMTAYYQNSFRIQPHRGNDGLRAR